MAFVAVQDAVHHVFLMHIDAAGSGSDAVRLTSDAEAEDYPSWSPDGSRLVYTRAYDGSAIYVINADGSGEQRLSATPGYDVNPSWSPDGTQIVFMSLMNGSDLQIYTMNADGSDLEQLTTRANNGDPVWSPDGTHISFGSDREGGGKLNVFVMNADGSNPLQLTHFNVPDEAGDTNWSSDGRKIAFEYDIDGMQQSDPNAYAEVWTMNSDGSDPTATGVPCSDVGCAPRWRPQ